VQQKTAKEKLQAGELAQTDFPSRKGLIILIFLYKKPFLLKIVGM